jgi:hypothetical protein
MRSASVATQQRFADSESNQRFQHSTKWKKHCSGRARGISFPGARPRSMPYPEGPVASQFASVERPGNVDAWVFMKDTKGGHEGAKTRRREDTKARRREDTKARRREDTKTRRESR